MCGAVNLMEKEVGSDWDHTDTQVGRPCLHTKPQPKITKIITCEHVEGIQLVSHLHSLNMLCEAGLYRLNLTHCMSPAIGLFIQSF